MGLSSTVSGALRLVLRRDLETEKSFLKRHNTVSTYCYVLRAMSHQANARMSVSVSV